ncbi:hypothetical protein ACH5RR_037325 [Cinchona calisaya]|uniref:Uncharacterized protein n=1 Tax=Cinchona calisaya TaxID=153742 RepID=A0ABD2Y785_9GENT
MLPGTSILGSHPSKQQTSNSIVCQLCSNPGNIASYCPLLQPHHQLAPSASFDPLKSFNALNLSTIESKVPSPHSPRPLYLRNVLHVPQLSHDLLSVCKLCCDNYYNFNFNSSSFSMKDNKTRMPLLYTDSHGDLYPISSTIISPYPRALTARHVPTQVLAGSFNALKFLPIHTCPRLEFVLSLSMLPFLVSLEDHIIKDCASLIDIIRSETKIELGGGADELPKLKKLEL